jgi:PAS domain S-box-containing protein
LIILPMFPWFSADSSIRYFLKQLVEAFDRWWLSNRMRYVDIRDEPSETICVFQALNTMAVALEARERELDDARRETRQATARITALFEGTIDCILIVDRNWRIFRLNERAKEQLTEERNLIGESLWQMFPDVIDLDILAHLREATPGRCSSSYEKFSTRRDTWYKINAFPSDEGLAIVFRDVTELKRAAEERRLIAEQLHQSQKMEAIGQLAGGIAHDFNNLLTVISASLETIEDAANDKERVSELAVSARKAAFRAAGLIAQLLAFSRQRKLDPRPVYVDALIRDFMELIGRAIGTGCHARLIANNCLWPCQVDPVQLETALLNLALNSRDAMSGSGTLEIKAKNVTIRQDAVAGVAAGSYVRLAVKDSGCGMAPEIVARAFEPFFTTKEVGKGTGLGLSMVYGFVRRSGGYATIESALGAGTTVSLYLPKSDQLPCVEIPGGTQTNPFGREMTITS